MALTPDMWKAGSAAMEQLLGAFGIDTRDKLAADIGELLQAAATVLILLLVPKLRKLE